VRRDRDPDHARYALDRRQLDAARGLCDRRDVDPAERLLRPRAEMGRALAAPEPRPLPHETPHSYPFLRRSAGSVELRQPELMPELVTEDAEGAERPHLALGDHAGVRERTAARQLDWRNDRSVVGPGIVRLGARGVRFAPGAGE